MQRFSIVLQCEFSFTERRVAVGKRFIGGRGCREELDILPENGLENLFVSIGEIVVGKDVDEEFCDKAMVLTNVKE